MDIGPPASFRETNATLPDTATWTSRTGQGQESDSCQAQDVHREDDPCTPMDTSEPPKNESAVKGVAAVASEQVSVVTEEPAANSLVSQVSLSHWASLTLDLSCLKEAASPEPEGAEALEAGGISPLELPPQKVSSDDTAGNVQAGASFRLDTGSSEGGQGPAVPSSSVKKSRSRQNLGLARVGRRKFEAQQDDTRSGDGGQGPAVGPGGVKKSGSKENLGLPRRGSREFREQQAAELAAVAADVSAWLGVLRGGVKRQGREGGWTGEEKAVMKRLAAAAGLGETIVRSKCGEQT